MTNFTTHGYESFELSTQCVIAEALRRGLTVEVLDASEQFIALSNGQKTEYVQQATKTSLDSYITSLILGNKWVTKQLLQRQGIAVPEGTQYASPTEAEAAYEHHRHGRWVVKPKTTNYGIGITMLDSPSPTDYTRALEEAFRHDTTVLVERFVEGIECRFLVIGGKTVAVLHRVPANVVGDGKQTIAELVAEKNRDPRRGKGHTTPLEKIQLGSTELAELKDQNLSPDSIPEAGVTIFLRQNSNISTGGDSLDYTEKVHLDYKTLAVSAAKTVGATICGVDMMLSAPSESPTPTNHAILELNYNPVLYFHNFPYQGKNRDVAKHLLDALGF